MLEVASGVVLRNRPKRVVGEEMIPSRLYDNGSKCGLKRQSIDSSGEPDRRLVRSSVAHNPQLVRELTFRYEFLLLFPLYRPETGQMRLEIS